MTKFPLAAELPIPELSMTEFIRTIVGLRETGFGYKRIARELRISRDEARHCAQLVDLGGVRGDIPPKRERPATRRARSCARCGAAIEIRHRGRLAKFCSQRCRDAAGYLLRKEVRPWTKRTSVRSDSPPMARRSLE